MKKLLLLALGALCLGSVFAQTTLLKPHFTEESKKVIVPKSAHIFPEIHEGLIAVGRYPQLLFVKTTGEYVIGTDFAMVRTSDYHSPYFNDGAILTWRNTERYAPNTPVIVYPDGRYRDLAGQDIITASDFLDGYAVVRKGNMMSSTQFFIDKNGKEVFPALRSTQRGTMGDIAIYPVKENRRVYYNAELKKYGYADAKGNIAIKPQFEKAHDFSEGMAAVMVDDKRWGIDFPDGMQRLNQRGLADGYIFAPDGTMLYTAEDERGYLAALHTPTEGGLMFCQVRIDSKLYSCFINTKGEIVYYFEEGHEGYEGPALTQIK